LGRRRLSCSEAWTPTAAQKSQDWLLGFWTGLNLGTRQDIAGGTSASGFVGRVRRHCDAEPTDHLVNAAMRAFLELERAGGK
jgi:hypothetical protein